jgi:hypothetical protein
MDVLEVRCGSLHGIEHVSKHGHVSFYVLHASFTELSAGGIEEMRYALYGLERTCAASLVQEICTNI